MIGAGPAGENVAGRCADGGLVGRPSSSASWSAASARTGGASRSKTLDPAGRRARRRPAGARRGRGGHRPDRRRAAVLARRDEHDRRTGTTAAPCRGWTSAASSWSRGAGRPGGRAHGRRRGRPTARVRRLAARRAVVLATGTSAALPPVTGWPTPGPGTTATSPRPRRCPGGCSCSAAARSALEMAQAFRRLGADEVTVVEGAPRLLAREEPFAGERGRARRSRPRASRAHRGRGSPPCTATADGPVTATLDDGTRARRRRDAGRRRPAPAHRRRSGSRPSGWTPGKYVEVDDRLRADGVRRRLALRGRRLQRPGPAHPHGQVPGADRRRRHPGQGRARPSPTTAIVPRVTFTDPQVRAVGLTEAQAREQGIDVRTVSTAPAASPAPTLLGDGIARHQPARRRRGRRG